MNINDIEGKYTIKENFTIRLDYHVSVIRVPNIIRNQRMQVFDDTVDFLEGKIMTVSVFESKYSDSIQITLESEIDDTKHRATFTFNKDDDKSEFDNLVSKYLEKI